MAEASMITLKKMSDIYVFSSSNGGEFFMTNNAFDRNGVVSIYPNSGWSSTYQFVKFITGCFEETSNFEFEICKALNYTEKFTGIKFCWNSTVLTVTKEEADIITIHKKWISEDQKKSIEYCKDKIRYFETSKGKEDLYMNGYRMLLDLYIYDYLCRIDQEIEFEFKDEETEKNWYMMFESKFNINSDTERYVRIWAKSMQKFISEGKSIDEIAEKTLKPMRELQYYFCLTNHFGVYYVVNFLVQYWKHGDELKNWYDAQKSRL